MSVIVRAWRMALMAIVLFGAIMAAPAALAQDTVTGTARAIDADIIQIDGKQRVILWAVDAPDRDQIRQVGDLTWACYTAARQALDDILATGPVTCVLNPAKADPFGRKLGVCKIGDLDVGAEMVRTGMARDYIDQGPDYLPEEEEAKTAAVGIWQPGANIIAPWEWRKRNPGGYR